ncbi:MAG: glutathione S-transferase family protein [Spirochaetaceae bacterium]|nr:glutathione S-transferase family protein [Spirochaetaceae bacterium]
MSLKLTGAGLSPYVRKVRTILAEKGLAYEHEPMMPFGVSDDYKRKHPLGKIPLLEDGDRVIPDSSAAAVYLERIQPSPALFPEDPYLHARAVWLEEFGDSAVTSIGGAYFQENVLARAFFKREPDAARLEKVTTEEIPRAFDYLEQTLEDADYLVGGRFTIADIACVSPLANFAYGGGAIDAKRWPRLVAYVERVQGRPSMKALIEEDRRALSAMGG